MEGNDQPLLKTHLIIHTNLYVCIRYFRNVSHNVSYGGKLVIQPFKLQLDQLQNTLFKDILWFYTFMTAGVC